jgi:hypothetical protein
MKPPGTISKKPDAKLARFQPNMPQIPGVPAAKDARPGSGAHGLGSRQLAKIGGIVAAAFLIGIAILWWMRGNSKRAGQSPSPETSVAESTGPADSSSAPPSEVPAGEGGTIAATSEELSKPWAAKTFIFVKPVTRENVEAIVIRLPGGNLWSFSLQEPYGQCKLEYMTDLNRLAKQYSYRASHPMVVNPCNSTIYDPMKIGQLGEGVWARGEIVRGMGLRPPISIEVQASGNSIIASRIE